ncbi:hypothetical protein [Nocardia rhamnosiphila]|uniref:N-terminal of MaoC-like dehydratase domain-containing protein n=1 Tax=Nocardia rhamnosiphila TaxID=426716 RepID=A0ABV2WRC3_9NOCA
MTIDIQDLARQIGGKPLPGGEIFVEPYESAIADEALQARVDHEYAHPAWFVIASLRGMGVSVDELRALAHEEPGDTLLFGSCTVDQRHPLRVGGRYITTATIGEVASRAMRDGTRLDSVQVCVSITGADDHIEVGGVTSMYLFKRGAEA